MLEICLAAQVLKIQCLNFQHAPIYRYVFVTRISKPFAGNCQNLWKLLFPSFVFSPSCFSHPQSFLQSSVFVYFIIILDFSLIHLDNVCFRILYLQEIATHISHSSISVSILYFTVLFECAALAFLYIRF